MDNLTHGLVGALVGQAGLKRKTGLAMPALILGANLPDVDAAFFFWMEGVEHLGFRRGITHGPVALLLLPAMLAGALWGIDRWQQRKGRRPQKRLPVHLDWLFALSFLACLTHPALDWLNVYGIRLLEPFSHQWFHGDTLFIIDPWLWALMGLATWSSRRAEKQGRGGARPAAIALLLALGYIALNGAITALSHATRGERSEPYPREYIASPMPIWSLGREHIALMRDGRWVSSGWDGPSVGHGYRMSREAQCRLPDLTQRRRSNSQLDAFLFWSRAPLAVRAADGSITLYDARYYDPRARDRFSVRLPEVKCVVLADGKGAEAR